VVPGTVTYIDEAAFEDCFEAVICAPKGSYAERFAKRNGFRFVSAEDEAARRKKTERSAQAQAKRKERKGFFSRLFSKKA
jgi:hypothetical protein